MVVFYVAQIADTGNILITVLPVMSTNILNEQIALNRHVYLIKLHVHILSLYHLTFTHEVVK